MQQRGERKEKVSERGGRRNSEREGVRKQTKDIQGQKCARKK